MCIGNMLYVLCVYDVQLYTCMYLFEVIWYTYMYHITSNGSPLEYIDACLELTPGVNQPVKVINAGLK